MRELKFRAWDEYTRAFVEIDLRNRPPDVNLWQSDDIQQYTGLEDMNGREVCEGDLLRGKNTPLFTVVFYNGSFKLRWQDNGPDYAGKRLDNLVNAEAMNDLLEVVGNIYQNSELLK
jgi:uncharacterized phage protein (TIGR01671 family)